MLLSFRRALCFVLVCCLATATTLQKKKSVTDRLFDASVGLLVGGAMGYATSRSSAEDGMDGAKVGALSGAATAALRDFLEPKSSQEKDTEIELELPAKDAHKHQPKRVPSKLHHGAPHKDGAIPVSDEQPRTTTGHLQSAKKKLWKVAHAISFVRELQNTGGTTLVRPRPQIAQLAVSLLSTSTGRAFTLVKTVSMARKIYPKATQWKTCLVANDGDRDVHVFLTISRPGQDESARIVSQIPEVLDGSQTYLCAEPRHIGAVTSSHILEEEEGFFENTLFDSSELPAEYSVLNDPDLADCKPTFEHILDQGQCGSCYAVSATSILRDRICIDDLRRGSFPDPKLSKQIQSKPIYSLSSFYPLSCGSVSEGDVCTDSKLYAGGCEGGKAMKMFHFASKVGLVAEADVPYPAAPEDELKRLSALPPSTCEIKVVSPSIKEVSYSRDRHTYTITIPSSLRGEWIIVDWYVCDGKTNNAEIQYKQAEVQESRACTAKKPGRKTAVTRQESQSDWNENSEVRMMHLLKAGGPLAVSIRSPGSFSHPLPSHPYVLPAQWFTPSDQTRNHDEVEKTCNMADGCDFDDGAHAVTLMGWGEQTHAWCAATVTEPGDMVCAGKSLTFTTGPAVRMVLMHFCEKSCSDGKVSFERREKIPYWLLRNAYGATWGDQGFFKVIRDPHTIGLMSRWAYPIVHQEDSCAVDPTDSKCIVSQYDPKTRICTVQNKCDAQQKMSTFNYLDGTCSSTRILGTSDYLVLGFATKSFPNAIDCCAEKSEPTGVKSLPEPHSCIVRHATASHCFLFNICDQPRKVQSPTSHVSVCPKRQSWVSLVFCSEQLTSVVDTEANCDAKPPTEGFGFEFETVGYFVRKPSDSGCTFTNVFSQPRRLQVFDGLSSVSGDVCPGSSISTDYSCDKFAVSYSSTKECSDAGFTSPAMFVPSLGHGEAPPRILPQGVVQVAKQIGRCYWLNTESSSVKVYFTEGGKGMTASMQPYELAQMGKTCPELTKTQTIDSAPPSNSIVTPEAYLCLKIYKSSGSCVFENICDRALRVLFASDVHILCPWEVFRADSCEDTTLNNLVYHPTTAVSCEHRMREPGRCFEQTMIDTACAARFKKICTNNKVEIHTDGGVYGCLAKELRRLDATNCAPENLPFQTAAC